MDPFQMDQFQMDQLQMDQLQMYQLQMGHFQMDQFQTIFLRIDQISILVYIINVLNIIEYKFATNFQGSKLLCITLYCLFKVTAKNLS